MCGSGAVVCSLSLLIREAQACPLSGRNSTQRPVQILEAGSAVAAREIQLPLFPLCDWRKITVAIDRFLAHATDEQEERECYADDHPAEDGTKLSVGSPVVSHHDLR